MRNILGRAALAGVLIFASSGWLLGAADAGGSSILEPASGAWLGQFCGERWRLAWELPPEPVAARVRAMGHVAARSRAIASRTGGDLPWTGSGTSLASLSASASGISIARAMSRIDVTYRITAPGNEIAALAHALGETALAEGHVDDAAVARAVMDSVNEGVFNKAQANDLCILVGVFIHWQAEDDKKIYQFNYQAVKESIARALQGKPSVEEVLSKYKAARHPFASGAEG